MSPRNVDYENILTNRVKNVVKAAYRSIFSSSKLRDVSSSTNCDAHASFFALFFNGVPRDRTDSLPFENGSENFFASPFFFVERHLCVIFQLSLF